MIQKLLLICFLDMLSYAIFSPIVSFLFLDGRYSILTTNYTEYRHLLLGLFLSTYSAIQVFSAPFLGKLALSVGKKKVLFFAFVGNVIGYLTCIFGIYRQEIYFLFAGAAVSGLTGANMPMIYAFISSLKNKSQWSRTFSLFGSAIGLAFTIGPFFTSYLMNHWSDMTVYYVTLGVCVVISFINGALVLFFIKDTTSQTKALQIKNPLRSLLQIVKLNKETKTLLLFLFLIYFSWFSFIKFFQVFLFENQNLNEEICCKLTSYLGLFCTIWQGMRFFLHKPYFEQKSFLNICTVLMGISFSTYFLSSSIIHTVIHIILISFFYSMLIPSILAVLFQKSMETKELTASFYQSVQSFAKILAPIIAGLLTSVTASTPFFMSCTVFVAVLILTYSPASFTVGGKTVPTTS